MEFGVREDCAGGRARDESSAGLEEYAAWGWGKGLAEPADEGPASELVCIDGIDATEGGD